MVTLRTKNLLRKLIGDGNMFPEKFHERIMVPMVMGTILFCVLLMAATSFGVSMSNRDDLIHLTDSLVVFLGYVPWISCYWYLLTHREKFYCLFNDVEDIIRKRMSMQPEIFIETRKQIDFYSHLFRKTQLIPTICLFFSPYVSVIYQWLSGNYSVDSWFYMNKIWVPFELNTTLRCASIVFLEILNVSCAVMILYWATTTFVEFMLYTKAFVKDTEATFTQMDGWSKNSRNSECVVVHCKEIIVLMSRINRCMSQLSDLVNFMGLVIVLPAVMDNVFFLFTFEMYLDRTALSNLIVPMLGIVVYLVLLFILFFSGQILHLNLLELGDVIYHSEWYRYPHTVQRCIIVMMMRAQQPFYLSIYGVLVLHLDNFVQILKRTYSAYMMLHSMD